jgi:hypothetical protein
LDVAIRHVVTEVLAVEVDDGLNFDRSAISAEAIREGDGYSGVRVHVGGRLSAARLRFHVDVNVGDPITPPPQRVSLPRLLGGEIDLVGYPIEMVLAEKIVTAVERGTANTRWRDFVDIAALTTGRIVDGDRLGTSIESVAAHRGAELSRLTDVLDGYADLAQVRWARWRAKNQLEKSTPQQFSDLLSQVFAFADPPLDGAADGRTWDPASRAWTQSTY